MRDSVMQGCVAGFTDVYRHIEGLATLAQSHSICRLTKTSCSSGRGGALPPYMKKESKISVSEIDSFRSSLFRARRTMDNTVM